MRLIVLIVVMCVAAPVAGQESQFRSDLRREGENIVESCDELSLKAIGGCAMTLATADPFHIALGNLAPQNGFGFGLAFVEHYTPDERWRLGWNADVVNSVSGSWRAGAYMKVILVPDAAPIVVRPGGTTPAPSNTVTIREYPILNLYAQSTSLEKLFFFGPGPRSARSGKSVYGEQQTIIGTNVIVPLPVVRLPTRTSDIIQDLRPSLVGAVNGRFVRVHGNTSESTPSIAQLYDDIAAPGLDRQTTTFLQFEEGIRLKPSAFNGRLQMNYLVDFQQFLASAASRSSFHRWTVDLKHEIPLYRTVSSSGPKDTNGPDECFQSIGNRTCPPVSTSRNREGTIGLRLLKTSSAAASGNNVPFYFQPTIGGSDINGQRLLPSYDDYRFRGTDLLVFQESLEHSIWGPVGVLLLADQGKVGQQRGDSGFGGLAHSFAVGVSIRAGGFPVINLSFAWGGEGRHVIGAMDASLLGGSSRPSLH